MNINIQFIEMSTTNGLEIYILEKLAKIQNHYTNLIEVNVSVKHKKSSKDKGKVCKIELTKPNGRIFALSEEKDFKLAVKNTITSILKQL